MAHESYNAPRKHCWVEKYLPDPKHSDVIPFQTKEVVLSELKKGDVIAQPTAWETEDMIILYKVLRINKKTISVVDCDQDGSVIYYPSYPTADKPRKSKLTLWNGYKCSIVV